MAAMGHEESSRQETRNLYFEEWRTNYSPRGKLKRALLNSALCFGLTCAALVCTERTAYPSVLVAKIPRRAVIS